MWFINQTLSFYRFCSLFSEVSTRESLFASLIQSVNLITVAHTSTVKVHGRFCHLFILFLKQQIIRSTSSEYNKYIFPLFSILNYYISKVVYNRFIMKSFLPFSAASCNSDFLFPLLMNAALRRGACPSKSGGGVIRPTSWSSSADFPRFASAAETDHSEITSSLLSSAVLKWVRPWVELEPAERCPQWSGTERQPPPWTDELAEMSRHIYTRHGIGEALQKPVCQVGGKKVF